MKSFIIQSLALIGAVVVIMDAASIQPKKSVLLELIYHDANNTLKKCSQEELNHRVLNPLGELKCVRCFFLEAEKSLNLTRFNESTLIKHLHQYNKLTNITNCRRHHNVKRTISLEHLLTNISECTKIHL